MTPFLAHSTPFRSHRSLSKVSTNSGEAHRTLLMPGDDLTIEHFRRRIAEAQERLVPYERDGVRSFDKNAQGNWVDVTAPRIDELKSEIDLYERCIRYIKSRE